MDIIGHGNILQKLKEASLGDEPVDEEAAGERPADAASGYAAAADADPAVNVPAGSCPVLMTTCSSAEGYRVVQQLGPVFGDVVFKTGLINTITATARNLTDFIRLGDRELSGTTRMLKNAREYAMEMIRQEATDQGANAVIGLQSRTSCGIDGLIQINLCGTAVRLVPVDAEAGCAGKDSGADGDAQEADRSNASDGCGETADGCGETADGCGETAQGSRAAGGSASNAYLKARLIYAQSLCPGENLRRELITIYKDTLSPLIKSILDKPDSCIEEAVEEAIEALSGGN